MRRVENQCDTDDSTISQRRFVTNGFFGNIGASLQNVSKDIVIGDGVEDYELEECVRQVSLMAVAESHLITVLRKVSLKDGIALQIWWEVVGSFVLLTRGKNNQ